MIIDWPARFGNCATGARCSPFLAPAFRAARAPDRARSGAPPGFAPRPWRTIVWRMTDGRRKIVIGLTGGIGSGKSLVARLLAELGCGVIDSDRLARQAMEDPQVKAQLARWWGTAVLDSAGRVDRRAVSRLVFAQPAELQRLEGLIHPRVHQGRVRLREQYEKDPHIKAIVEDTPMLMEKGLADACDAIVFVNSSPENRRRRVAAHRGWDEQELARREKAQVGLDSKAARADYVVDNNAGEAECLAQVRRVFTQILARGSGREAPSG
jgi:dephospho-CoA kinase